MFCPKCGKHVEKEGTKFCTECGYQLPFVSQSQYATSDGSRSNLDTNGEGHQEPIQIGNSYTTQPSMDEWAERNNAPKYIAPRPINSVQVKKKPKNKTVAILVAMLMIMTAVAIVIIDNNGSNDTDSSDDSEGSSTIIIGQSIGDYTVTYNGAFESGIFTYEETTHDMDSDGDEETCLMISLSDSYASNYEYYVWKVYDESSTTYVAYVYTSDGLVEYMYYSSSYDYTFSAYSGSTVAKSEACLYWSGYIAGSYVISVTCYESESDYTSSTAHSWSSSKGTTYSGDLRLDGDITTEYTWTYDGNSYELTVTYTYEEFEYYHNLTTTRDNTKSSSNVTNYVIVDDTISSIASQLQEKFQEIYGSDASLSGQSFANFVLAFVQCCYYYPAFNDYYAADMVVYGSDEYYAYPLETIFYGMGDCEDTSILAAAIYESCGYDVAIGLISNTYTSSGQTVTVGHAIVGVALDSYDTPSYNSSNYEILSQTVNGVTYYGGETTSDSYYALGVITKGYASSIGTYYGTILCGFYVVN